MNEWGSTFSWDDFIKVDGGDAQPYVSDLAWALFSAYKGIVAYSFLQLQILSKGLDPTLLKDDLHLKVLKAALPHHSERIDSEGVAIGAKLFDELAANLLSELRRVIEGREQDHASVNRGVEIIKHLRGGNADLEMDALLTMQA